MGIPVLNYPDAAYVHYRTRSRALEHVNALANEAPQGVGEDGHGLGVASGRGRSSNKGRQRQGVD